MPFQIPEKSLCLCQVGWLDMVRSDFSLFLKLSSARWACWGTAWGGKGLAPNPDAVFAPGIICLLEENWKVPQHQPRLADMKPKSAHQSWLLVSGLRKHHWSMRHLTPCHSFQILHLFFTLNQHQMPFSENPPHLPLFTAPPPNPTLCSLGIQVPCSHPRYLLSLRSCLNNTRLPVFNLQINTCLAESLDRWT